MPRLPSITWNGRPVRTGTYAGRAAGGSDAGRPAPPLVEGLPPMIPPEGRAAVAEELGRTRTQVERLRSEADRRIAEHVHVPIDGRALLGEAVRYLAGTHDDFGRTRPAVPEAERLSDTQITPALFQRARRVLARAPQIAYGFDPAGLLHEDFDGRVDALGPIATPAQAAGEAPVEVVGKKTVEEAVEGRLMMTRTEIAYMIFTSTMEFLSGFLEDFFRGIERRVHNALSFKILGKRIRVGRFVSWPFKVMADLFRNWRRYWAERARLQTPRAPEAPDPEAAPYTSPAADDGEEDDGVRFPDVPWDLNADVMASGSWRLPDDSHTGLIFLMAAQEVVSATETAALDRPGLFQALTLETAASHAEQLYTAYSSIAAAAGVPVPGTPPDGPPTPGDPSPQPAPPPPPPLEGGMPPFAC